MLEAPARDRLYAALALAIDEAGPEREALFLSRLALVLFESLGDETAASQAVADARRELPSPSLSARS
jgi:hypothetical protein